MKKYRFKLLTSTGLGHEYFYCYGDEHFEQWLKRKNIKYEIDKKSINRFNELQDRINKAIEYIELGLADEDEAEELLNILKGDNK